MQTDRTRTCKMQQQGYRHGECNQHEGCTQGNSYVQNAIARWQTTGYRQVGSGHDTWNMLITNMQSLRVVGNIMNSSSAHHLQQTKSRRNIVAFLPIILFIIFTYCTYCTVPSTYIGNTVCYRKLFNNLKNSCNVKDSARWNIQGACRPIQVISIPCRQQA
jgi:hypothetical protein